MAESTEITWHQVMVDHELGAGKIFPTDHIAQIAQNWNATHKNASIANAQDMAYDMATHMFQQRVAQWIVNNNNNNNNNNREGVDEAGSDFLVMMPVNMFQQDWFDCRRLLHPASQLEFLRDTSRGHAHLPMLPENSWSFEVDVMTVCRFLPDMAAFVKDVPPLVEWLETPGLAYRQQCYLRNIHRVLLRYSPHHFPLPSVLDAAAYHGTAASFRLCSLDVCKEVPQGQESQTLQTQRSTLVATMGDHVETILKSMSDALDSNPRYCPWFCAEQPSRASMSHAALRRVHLLAWSHVEQDARNMLAK
jgi:hypothetical protein